MLLKIFVTYLVLVNAAGFILMLVDKQKARKGAWRISEATLLGTALIGGSIGSIAGMNLFRHKTKHLKFSLGLPVILALQIMVALFIMIRL